MQPVHQDKAIRAAPVAVALSAEAAAVAPVALVAIRLPLAVVREGSD